MAQTIWKFRFSTLTLAIAAPHIIRAMPSGLLVSDSDGHIVIFNDNAAEYLNRSASELRQATIQNVLGDLFSPAELQGLVENNEPRDYEIMISDPAIKHRLLSISASLMRQEEKGPPRWTPTLRQAGWDRSQHALRRARRSA